VFEEVVIGAFVVISDAKVDVVAGVVVLSDA
jgi:hypothetical protein